MRKSSLQSMGVVTVVFLLGLFWLMGNGVVLESEAAYELKETQQMRLVSTISPDSPTWAVYYRWNRDDIVTRPVLCYNVWEFTRPNEAGNTSKTALVFPVIWNRLGEFVEEDKWNLPASASPNYLGLSSTASPTKEQWQNEIDLALLLREEDAPRVIRQQRRKRLIRMRILER